MDLDPAQHPPDMRDQAPGQAPPAPPQPMRQAVIDERVKPRIAQYNLEPRPGGRVAVESRVNFVAEVFDEHRGHYVILKTATLPLSARSGSRAPTRAYNCPTTRIKYVAAGADGVPERMRST